MCLNCEMKGKYAHLSKVYYAGLKTQHVTVYKKLCSRRFWANNSARLGLKLHFCLRLSPLLSVCYG